MLRTFGSFLTVLSVLLATPTLALVYTTTLDFVDGNTEIVSVGTNALGLATTAVISTLGLNGAGTATATSTTTTGKKTTTTGRPTTTQQAVVGNTPVTDGPPMKTTTYWYPGPDGVWVAATWTASVTSVPTVATVVVPAGTIQDYNSYQASANSVVLASAEATQSGSTGVGTNSAGQTKGLSAVHGWIGMVIGIVGAGWVMMI